MSLSRFAVSLLLGVSAVVVLAWAVDAAAPQRVFYVAPDGSDRGPGTEALPFRTIARGARMLTPGSVLYVKSGTYPEALINAIPGGTSPEAPVTIAAYPGSTVIVKPEPGAGFVLHFQGPAQAYITISGLILDASNVTYDAVKITGTDNPADAAHHIRIVDSEVRKSPRNGILTTNFAHSNEFVNLKVHSNGDFATRSGHGFYLATGGNLVQGCDIHDNAFYGIQVYASRRHLHQNIVRSNAVFGNQQGMVLSRGADHVAQHNTVYNNHGVGIRVDYAVKGVGLYNNIVYGNGAQGILVGKGSTDTTLVDNIVYGNKVDIVDRSPSGAS